MEVKSGRKYNDNDEFIYLHENNIVNLIGRLAVDKDFETTIFSFSNPIGITIYLLMQIVLGYVLSRFLINTRRKSKEFLKTEIILRDISR